MKTITRQDLEDIATPTGIFNEKKGVKKRINFKTLCEYAKENISQFDYKLEETSEHRPHKHNHQPILYGGHRLYTGYILRVYPKNSYVVKDGKSYRNNHNGVNQIEYFNSLRKFDHHNLVNWILQHIS